VKVIDGGGLIDPLADDIEGLMSDLSRNVNDRVVQPVRPAPSVPALGSAATGDPLAGLAARLAGARSADELDAIAVEVSGLAAFVRRFR
jgi:hypothetical protein